MTIVEADVVVTGGVDTHLDAHVAATLNDIGGVLGVETSPATAAGYRALTAWMRTFGAIGAVGVEGTGSYGAGLARHLRRAGVEVFEVDRPTVSCGAGKARPTRSTRWKRRERRSLVVRSGERRRVTATWKRSGRWWWPNAAPVPPGSRR